MKVGLRHRLPQAKAFFVAVWAFFLTWYLASIVLDPARLRFNIRYFTKIELEMLLWTLPVVVGVIFLNRRLIRLHPFFRKSLASANLNLVPLLIPICTIGYGLLLILNLPYLVFVEEVVFRDGTQNWVSALGRSVVFGFTHFLVGVPVGACCGISALGMWFTWHYMNGGLEQATSSHLVFNSFVIILVSYSVMRESIKTRKARSQSPEALH